MIMPVFALAGVPSGQLELGRSLAVCVHTVNLLIGRTLWGYFFSPPNNLNTKIFNHSNDRSYLCLFHYLLNKKPDFVFQKNSI